MLSKTSAIKAVGLYNSAFWPVQAKKLSCTGWHPELYNPTIESGQLPANS